MILVLAEPFSTRWRAAAFGRITGRNHRKALAAVAHDSPVVEPLYIEPGSPWGERLTNRIVQWKMRDQFLNGESSIRSEAQIRRNGGGFHYNTVRPHRSLGRPATGPETVQFVS